MTESGFQTTPYHLVVASVLLYVLIEVGCIEGDLRGNKIINPVGYEEVDVALGDPTTGAEMLNRYF